MGEIKQVRNAYWLDRWRQIIQERGQVRLQVLDIGHRLRQLAARNWVQSFHPQPIILKQGFRLRLTRCFSHRITHSREFLLSVLR